jgi:Mg-chelatase subunit ChlD/uncharacterized low-complexity protein
MQTILITDALDAVEKNIKAFLEIARQQIAKRLGVKEIRLGSVSARIDSYTGTASIKHWIDTYSNTINVEVYFPALPNAYKLSKDELNRWIGYFIHEICHAIYTDETAWKDACRERLHDIVNGLEDPRIEKCFNDDAIAANSRMILTDLVGWCVGKLPANYDPNDASNLPWLFAMAGRVVLCGYDLPDAEKHLLKLNRPMKAMLDWVMADLAKARNTSDVLDIARKLQRQFQNAKADSGKVNPGEGKAGEGKAGEGKAGEGKAAGEGKVGKGGSGTGDGDSSGVVNELPQADITRVKPVEMNPLSDEIKGDMLPAGSREANNESIMAESIRKAARNAGKEPKATQTGSCRYDLTMNDLRTATVKTGKLKAQVARILKAEESESWDRSRSSGRLDRFALNRIGMGQTENVYAKRSIRQGYETEIAILIDSSGSMSGNRIWAAGVLACAIAQAAQSVGVKSSVYRFHSSSFALVKSAKDNPANGIVLDRFLYAATNVGGSTPLSGSIIKVAAKLAAKGIGKRKLLFVVSDGDCDFGPEMVRKACAYAERLDVEPVGLFIDMVPNGSFRNAATCDSAHIAETGLGLLVRTLERD